MSKELQYDEFGPISGKLGGPTWVEQMTQPAVSPKLTFEAVVKGLDAITNNIDALGEQFPNLNFYEIKKELGEFLLDGSIVTLGDLTKNIDEGYIPSLRASRSWVKSEAAGCEAAATLLKDTVAAFMNEKQQGAAIA